MIFNFAYAIDNDIAAATGSQQFSRSIASAKALAQVHYQPCHGTQGRLSLFHYTDDMQVASRMVMSNGEMREGGVKFIRALCFMLYRRVLTHFLCFMGGGRSALMRWL